MTRAKFAVGANLVSIVLLAIMLTSIYVELFYGFPARLGTVILHSSIWINVVLIASLLVSTYLATKIIFETKKATFAISIFTSVGLLLVAGTLMYTLLMIMEATKEAALSF